MEQIEKERYLRGVIQGDARQSDDERETNLMKSNSKFQQSVARLVALEVSKNGRKVDQVLHKPFPKQIDLERKTYGSGCSIDNYRVSDYKLDNSLPCIRYQQSNGTSTQYRMRNEADRSFMKSSLIRMKDRVRSKSDQNSTEFRLQNRKPTQELSKKIKKSSNSPENESNSMNRPHLNRFLLPALSTLAKKPATPIDRNCFGSQGKDFSHIFTKYNRMMKFQNAKNRDSSDLDCNQNISSSLSEYNEYETIENDNQPCLKKPFFLKKLRPEESLPLDYNDYYMEIVDHKRSLDGVFSIYGDWSPKMSQVESKKPVSLNNIIEMVLINENIPSINQLKVTDHLNTKQISEGYPENETSPIFRVYLC